jgi:hypothetical protein
MADLVVWYPRLSKIAFSNLSLSLIASLGATELSYNVAIALFVIYSCENRTGRVNAQAAFIILLSIVADIFAFGMYSDRWASHAVISLTCGIVNLLVKFASLLVMSLIYNELGMSRVPLRYSFIERDDDVGNEMTDLRTDEGLA